MPRSGGPSTITGVDFEAWFVALKFIDAFFDEKMGVKPQAQTCIDSQTKETKITAIDDIYIYSDSKQKFYNLKFRAPDIKSWSISDLKQQKVLSQLKEQFTKAPDTFLYFATQSPCPIFAEVLPRGAFCTSRKELEIKLKPNKYIEKWDKLKSELGFLDDKMLEFAQQVKFKHVIDTEEIEDLIVRSLKGHITNLDSAPNCLYQLAIKAGKQGRTITRKDIIKYFEKTNIHLKPHLRVEELSEKIHSASASLASVSHTFIKDIHIERDEVITIVNWIKTPLKEKASPIAVLLGKAGCGKTVIQRDLLIRLQEEKMPVLGIKTDLLTFDSIGALSNEIGLSDGIKETMAAIVEKYGKGVVLFDQLDALSLTMAKDRKPINTYFNLISQLSLIKGLRIILSCRTFDLKYDPTLNSFENKYSVNVKELSDQQVNIVLSELGIQEQQISNTLFSLLRVPLHLKVFCKIYKPHINLAPLNTLQDLYNQLWEQKILGVDDDSLQKDVIEAIDAAVEKMDSAKVLTIPFALLDRNSKGRNYLLSQSIFHRLNNKLQFFHSSFFDYCYARTFLGRHDSLIGVVVNQHQGLFVRPQVKQVLSYLRDNDPSRYIKELKEFLTNPKIRFHVRLLVINQLAFEENPIDEERQTVKQILEKDNNFKKHFIEGIQSEEWLRYLISNGFLQTFLQSGDEKLVNLTVWKLTTLINTSTDTIINFLYQFPNIANKNKCISYILGGLDHWEDERAVRLFQKYLPSIKSRHTFEFKHFLGKILKYNPKVVAKIFFDDLNAKADAIKSADDFDKNQFPDDHDIEIAKELLDGHLEIALPEALQIIHKLVNKTRWERKIKFCSDRAFYTYGQFTTDLYCHWRFLSLVLEKLKTVAIDDKSEFLKLVADFEESCSATLLKIVLQGYSAKPELYVNEGFKLLTKEGVLENMADEYSLRVLLKNIYPYFSKEEKEKTNEIILSVSPDWEKHREKGRPSSIGFTKYRLLNAIPKDELIAYPTVKKQFLELARKFDKYRDEPEVSEGGIVGPPLPAIAYEKMSFEQWLLSFQKYDETTSRGISIDLRGGILQHSHVFSEEVSKNPDKFYNFVFNLGKKGDISITYFGAGLDGLVKAKYDVEKIKQLVKTCWKHKDTRFRQRIIWAIDYIDKEDTLDLELINILADYASNDPHPQEELWRVDAGSGAPYYGGDPLGHGINTVRGSAAERLVIHGFKTQFPDKIFEILNRIAEDKSIAVRCCLIKYLHGMIKWDRDKVYDLFMKITNDKHPQVIKYGLECLGYLMTKDNFQKFISRLKMVLQIKGDSVSSANEYLGQILMLAYVGSYPMAMELLEEGFKINEEVKLGAIDFAARHLTCPDQEIAEKAGKMHLRFLNEDSDKISQKYDWYFRTFKVEDFNKIYNLIVKYSKSKAIEKHANFFFEFLAKCVACEPEKCIDLIQNCVKFGKPNIRYNTLLSGPVQILVEAYNRIIDDTYKERIMDIFDESLQEENWKREGLKVLADQDRE